MPPKSPATIVTGFLGAGKTTMIRHVLAERRRPAPRADHQRVRRRRRRRRNPEVLRRRGLPRGEHRRTRQRLHLLHRRRRFPAGHRDAAEARRPARPYRHRDLGPRAAEAAREGVRLAGDARQAHRRRRDRRGRRRAPSRRAGSPTMPRRWRASAPPIPRSITTIRSRRSTRTSLLCADIVVLNKTDLLSAGDAARVAAEMRATARGSTKVDRGAGRPRRSRRRARLASRRRGRHRRAALASRRRGGARPRRFRDLRRRRPGARRPRRLRRAARRSRRAAHDVLRIKGFLDVAGKPMRLLVQGVGARFRRSSTGRGGPARRGAGRLVVIGQKGLDRAAIEAALALMHLLRTETAIAGRDGAGRRSRAVARGHRRAVVHRQRSRRAGRGVRSGCADRARRERAAARQPRRPAPPLFRRSLRREGDRARRASCWCACSAASTIGATASRRSPRCARARGAQLAVVPGDARADARLDAASTLRRRGPRAPLGAICRTAALDNAERVVARACSATSAARVAAADPPRGRARRISRSARPGAAPARADRVLPLRLARRRHRAFDALADALAARGLRRRGGLCDEPQGPRRRRGRCARGSRRSRPT